MKNFEQRKKNNLHFHYDKNLNLAREHGSEGISKWQINLFDFPMMINKITLSVDYY